jgi:uncharacterized protein YutE (UPF0331/DUF86 family)
VVDRDVVLAKVAAIDGCLERIAQARGERRAVLLPDEVDDIVILNLQRAVQAAIDLAAHVVASEGYGLPDSLAGVFTLLEGQGVIDAELAQRMRRMVGFRNVAIHEYQALDPALVEAIVTLRLDDLRELSAHVIDRYGI